MKQDLEVNQIQYLVIFIKKRPSEGHEEFQKQLMQVATYSPEGTNLGYPYQTFISKDTKSKVIVSGEIPLDQGNILSGLIMAFPRLDLDSHMITIQKFSLVGDAWAEDNQAGAIVAAENWESREIRWDTPREYTLGEEDGLRMVSPFIDEIQPNAHGRNASISASLEMHEKPLLDDIDSGFGERRYSEDFRKFFGSAGGRQKDESAGEQSASEKIYLDDDPGFRGFLKATEAPEEDFLDDIPLPGDQNGIMSLDDFESMSAEQPPLHKVPAFYDTYEEDDGFAHHIPSRKTESADQDDLPDADQELLLGEGSGSHSTLWPPYPEDRERPKSSYELTHAFEESLYDEEDLPSAPLENIHPSSESFTLLGTMEEDDHAPMDKASLYERKAALRGHDDDRHLRSSFWESLQSLPGGDLLEKALAKVQALPLRKLGFASLAIGMMLIALALTARVIEPDFEASRRAAGIPDIYEWIIKNDLTGTNSEDWYRLWKNSPEYRQYWSWYDRQWSPTINRYRIVERGSSIIGVLLSASGLGILLAHPFLRTKQISDKAKGKRAGSSEEKRISLSFDTDADIWPIVEAWTRAVGFRILEFEDTRRLYRKSGNLSHPPLMCLVSSMDGEVLLEIWASTWVPPKLMPVFADLGMEVLEAKNALVPLEIREAVDSLLDSLA